MATPAYLTRSVLNTLVGAARVTQLFDDDGDGVLGASELATLDEVMAQAEGFALSYMLRGFTAEQVTQLAGADPYFLSAVGWVACEFASERPGQNVGADGRGRYWAQFERATAYFERLSKSQVHSKGEATAGANKQSGGSVKPKDPTTGKPPSFTFAADDDAPTGHGGF